MSRQSKCRSFFVFGVLALVALTPAAPGDEAPVQAVAPDGAARLAAFDRLQSTASAAQTLRPVQLRGELQFEVTLAGQAERIVLQKHTLRAPDFQVLVQDTRGALHAVAVPESETYRGYVCGYGGSSVTASIVGGRVRALAHLGPAADGIWVIEPLPTMLAEAGAGDHFVYRSEDQGAVAGFCGNNDIPRNPARLAAPPTVGAASLDVKVCRVACDADYEYYVLNGSSVADTTADIETIMDGVSAIYERDAGVAFQLTTIVVRAAEPDPYTASNVDGLLGQFRLEWKGNRADVLRDIAHLFTGRSFGTILGNGYTDQVCPGRDHYSLVRSRWDPDLGKRIALSAHEIGHTFDAAHCDSDPDARCRIMCPNLGGCSNGYHSFEDSNAARIRQTAAAASCLTAGVVTTPSTALPFNDNFDAITYPPRVPDPARWTAADLAMCQYKHLELSIGRDYNFNQKLGTVRTLPMTLSGSARVRYRVNANGIPTTQSLRAEYFDSTALVWRSLRTITSDGSGQYKAYEDAVPANGRGNHFAVRFSAYGTAYTASNAWALDDVNVEEAPRPALAIELTATNTVRITWSPSSADWLLEATASLTAHGSTWGFIPPPYPTNATGCVVTEPRADGTKFYRLRAL